MKFLVGTNGNGIYESLFHVQGNEITKVERKFNDYVCQFDDVEVMQVRLPLEMVDRILLFTFQYLLAAFHFEDAFYLACVSPHTIEMFYYFIYGSAPGIDWQTKKDRLSRTLYLMEEIYDKYITCQATFDTPAIILEWETTQFGREQMRTLFAPWQMESATVIGTYRDSIPPGSALIPIGPFYGDRITLTRCIRKECFIEATAIAHPMITILVLNQLRACSTWTNTTTTYLFSRFAMLLKFCFGPVYYYAQKSAIVFNQAQINALRIPVARFPSENSDDEDAFFTYKYVFQEALNCVRK